MKVDIVTIGDQPCRKDYLDCYKYAAIETRADYYGPFHFTI